MSTTDTAVLLNFFEQLFQYDEGYLCIGTMRPPARRDTYQDNFFEWPKKKHDAIEFIEKVTPTHNVYFGINILSAARRKKDNCIPQNLVWADLDTCHPASVSIPPQVVIASSPGRFQAVWKLDAKVDPLIAENYSKRIAYAYANQGVDKSGHDLTQLLRVPTTFNFKYMTTEAPTVELIADVDGRVPASAFEALPLPEGTDIDLPDIAVPDIQTLPSYEMIVYRYTDQLTQHGLMNAFARYVGEEPPEDWSGHLWRLLLLCFEANMSAEEVFVVAKASKCNKYERDGRPDSHLWREILKAELERKTVEVLLSDHRYLAMPALLNEEDYDNIPTTFIDDYLDWAVEATDAVPEFHELCCAMAMSAVMSTTLRLPTSRGRSIVPNLWALILGDSGTTRKSTAMDMAMDFVMDLDNDIVISSDASMEGLMTSLALRPKMVSVFFRDEISGFFDSMQRKDYLAGMQETLTKLYDVPRLMKRTLKKDTYVVSEPIFMVMGGGVQDKLYSLVTEGYFTSGFVPRFLVVRGYPDMERIRPTGPPVDTGIAKRTALAATFSAWYQMYTVDQIVVTLHDGQKIHTTPEYEVIWTPEMWERAGQMEMALMRAALESPETDKASPAFTRLFVSLQKLTMLFAASRQEPEDAKIHANMGDLLCAAKYIEKWGRHTVDLVRNSGVTADESKIMLIYRHIEKHPGCMRSEIMQRFRMNARTMDDVESTLIQRMMLDVHKKGRWKSYWPVGR